MSFFSDLFSSKDNYEVPLDAEIDDEIQSLQKIKTIDVDTVNLKANELRSTNLDNMLSKMTIEIPDMGGFVNQNLNTQTNNNTILPDVGSINEDASVVKDRISNYK